MFIPKGTKWFALNSPIIREKICPWCKRDTRFRHKMSCYRGSKYPIQRKEILLDKNILEMLI